LIRVARAPPPAAFDSDLDSRESSFPRRRIPQQRDDTIYPSASAQQRSEENCKQLWPDDTNSRRDHHILAHLA